MTTSSHEEPALAAQGGKVQHEWAGGDPLEPPEQALLDHAFNGTRLDFVGEGRVGHEEMKEWGSSRTVRAAVLRHLLIDPQWQVDSKGVRLRGARITGRLDLESAVVRCPLVLANCYLDSPDPVVLAYATASRIVLTRCRVVGGLAADLVVVSKQLDLSGSAFEGVVLLSGADITGELLCRGAELTGADFDGNALAADRIKVDGDTVFDGATATGAVRLLGAHIIGQLSWRNAHLTGTDRDGDALIGDRMRVGGSVFLDQQFTAAGAVRLPGVDIVGQLSCRGAELTGTDSDGNALGGDGMKVGGGVFFDQATAAGAVRLLDADITGSLSWRKAQLTGADRNSNALIGDRMKVDGSVFFDQATAAGAVRLLDADITGELSCGGAQLTGTDRDGDALIGDRMKVASDVFLDQQFTAAGAVCLRAARIAGSVWLNGAELAESVALRAVGVYVAGQLHWAPRSPVRGLVNLERAAVHRLDDNWGLPDAHWPPAGRLRLAGFTYEGFGGQHRASWRQRLDWIRRSHTTATGTAPAVFAGQPYEQLVRVYRQMGHESQARHVAIARRRDLRRYGSLTRLQKLGNWLLDKTIRYGYRPLRAVVGLVVIYVLVVLGALVAQHDDSVIVPAKDTKTITPAPTALHCSAGYPCFYPAGYAVDVVVPIINLRQAENWRLNGQAPWGWAYIAVGWFATGLGWAFTTLAVAGYTGLVRKE